jgi:hypothetical protein
LDCCHHGGISNNRAHTTILGFKWGAKLTGQRAAPEKAIEKNLPQWEINCSCHAKGNIGSIMCYHEKFDQLLLTRHTKEQ